MAHVTCPWCELAVAGPRALHAHLEECHGEEVMTGERGEKVFYKITCPLCGSAYEHVVRKAARDRAFLVGFGREIRLVALDMLVHHLMAEHDRADGGQDENGQSGDLVPGQHKTGE